MRMRLLRTVAGAVAGMAAAAAILFRRRSASGGGLPGSSRAPGSPGALRRPDEAPVSAAPDPSAGAGRAGLVGLQGNLAQTPLHDLLQYLALGRKTGILELASGRRTGRIVFSEGRIGRSAYRGKEGMEAAFLMMDLTEGDFEFYEPSQAQPQAWLGAGATSLEVVDVIMLWMERRPRKKQASQG